MCLEDVWRFDGGCLEAVLNKNPHLFSTGRKGPMCLEGVWKGPGGCLESV